MAQGLFYKGRRPKSKKEIREAVKNGEAERVSVEATSMFGHEYDGPLSEAPDGRITFVGPDPYTRRRFYGTITVRDGKVTVK